MKKMLLVFLLVALFTSAFGQTQTEFIIGAEWLNKPSNLNYELTQTDWNNIKDLGLNWGMCAYTDYTKAVNVLNAASSNNVKLMLERYQFGTPTAGQRWQYHPENFSQYPNTGRTGRTSYDVNAEIYPDEYDPNSQNQPNTWQAQVGTHSAGYMAQGLLVDTEQVDGYTYYVKLRIRLENGVPLTHSSVVTVSAVRISDGASQSQTIYADNPVFQAGDHYAYKEITAFSFNKNTSGPMMVTGQPIVQSIPESDQLNHPNTKVSILSAPSGSAFDYRVYWNGQVSCYLDYIIVDDYNANHTFTGYYNTAINQEVNNFKGFAGLGRFKIRDEINPDYYGQYLTAGYVEKIIKANVTIAGYPTKTGLHYNVGYWWLAKYNTGEEYIGRDIAWTQNNQSLVDIYPIYYTIVLPDDPSYTQLFQDRIQNALIKYLRPNIIYANEYSVPFWFAPQVHYLDNGLREPTTLELKQMVNLGLVYGAKGINYFLYRSDYLPAYDDQYYGLVNMDGTPRRIIYGGTSYSGDKWETVKAINQKLSGALGTTLMNLTWQNAFSIYQGQPTGTYITSITTSDAANERYVELGFFNDVLNNDYFMLVNRRTKTTESRNISVTFNKSSSYTTWKVSEIGTNNIWIVSKTGSFQTTYSPGEGKLFKFEPLFLNSSETFSGNVYVNNSLTISAGKMLTIQQGTTLKFNSSSSLIVNGTLNAVGTSSESIKFTSQSGTSNSSWGTITFSGSGAAGSTMKYANVKYGTKVEAINTSNITIQYCNIDTTYDGIRFYNSSGSILNNKITTNSIGHGVAVENGSTSVTVNNNIITKTSSSRSGVGIYFGGGSNGNAARNDIYHWDWGISAIWSSSPTSTCGYSPQYNNRIRDCNSGLTVYRLSYPVFGIPPTSNNMWNSLSGNSYNAKVGMSYTNYESRLVAHGNYWGGYPPNTALFQIGPSANIYYSSALTSDPWSGIYKIAANDNTNSDDYLDISQTSEKDIELILYGNELRGRGKFNEAKNYFISYINENPDNQIAYIELYNCYNKETADEIIKFFSSLPEKASKDHKLLLAYLYLKNGDYIKAKEVNNSIIVENPDTELATKAKLNNVYIALYNEDNINEAIKIFNDALSKSKLLTPMELSIVRNAIENYGKTYGKEINGLAALPNFESSEQDLLKQEGLNKIGVPDKYQLLGNYPNPFNPSTTISYALPYQSSVEIIIYDLMGKEIKSFTVPSQSAGYNRLVWDGRNESGNPVTSGVYFYRISIKSLENNETFIKTAKMLMLK